MPAHNTQQRRVVLFWKTNKGEKLQEVAGGGFLITKDRSLRYLEFFTGLERVFKWPFNPLARVKLGVYVVGSVANKFNNPVQFKIGLTTWDRFRNNWR